MSDFHLQQLAAASASVPGNQNVTENGNIETNTLNSQQQPAGTAVMVPDAVPVPAAADPAQTATAAPSYSVFRFHSLPAPSVEACQSNISVNEVAHGNGNTTTNASTTGSATTSASASSPQAVDLNTHMTMQPHAPHAPLAEAVHVHYHVHPPQQFQTQLQTQAFYHHHQQQQHQYQHQQHHLEQLQQLQQQQQQHQQQQPFGYHLQTQQHGNVHRNDNGAVVDNNIPSIPPPHPAHAPHPPDATTATTTNQSQLGMSSFALLQPEPLTDPIHHHNQLTHPVTVTTNTTQKADSNAVSGTVTDTNTHAAKGTHHAASAVDAVDPAKTDDLYAKYKAKCDECESLINALNMKTARVRKLEKDLSSLKAQHNVNNNKTSANGQKDAATSSSLSHDQGNGGANASIGFPQGDNNNQNKNNNMAMNNSSITIDVDIGPSSSRTRSYDQRWKARFQDLVKYKLTHGDCIVPKSYKDKGLHSWVRKQRILKKDFDLGLASEESMTQERVNALQSVGFAWIVGHQSNDGQWESNFQQLVVFKSQYGHTRVPQAYDKTLHKWVLNQRCRRRLLEDKGEGKAKGMTWARIEKLDAIDFSWTGKK